MNLAEAMRKAYSEKKYVSSDAFKHHGVKIAPDEHQNYCNLINEKEKTVTPMWEPGIADFLDDTGDVVD